MSISTLRLYEIAGTYLRTLEDLAEMEDLPAEVIADTLEGLHGGFQHKAVNVAAYIRTLEAEASAIGEVRKRMEQRQRSLERHAERLREYLQAQMERVNLPKIKNCYLTLRLQANPPSVVVEDEEAIPACYKQEVITVKVLKSEIAKALKGGGEVAGARLEQSNRLVIQ